MRLPADLVDEKGSDSKKSHKSKSKHKSDKKSHRHSDRHLERHSNKYDLDDSEQYSYSETDEGELSDTGDNHVVTEDINYQEAVWLVRLFMGWKHIPVFEADFSELDKSNNPWKGKIPKRPAPVSVVMPPDDWLCQKLERLNTTVAEGYLSRSQDSGGLKKDQFIRMPKWYQMHTIKEDAPHKPGKSVFSWRNTEAKVNS